MKKRVLSLFLVVVMALSLCACVSDKDVETAMQWIHERSYTSHVRNNRFKRIMASQKLEEAILEEMDQIEDFEALCEFIAKVQTYQVESEAIKEKFVECAKESFPITESMPVSEFKEAFAAYFGSINELRDASEHLYDGKEIIQNIIDQEDFFGSMDTQEFSDYLDFALYYQDKTNCEVIMLFPYQPIKAFLEAKGLPQTIVEGEGYFNENKDPRDIDYWYDPLQKERHHSGEGGMQHFTTKFKTFGDFYYFEERMSWYGTSKDGKHSEGISTYYFSGSVTGSNADLFLEKAESGEIYRIENTAIIVVNPAEFLVLMVDDTFFAIQYS